MFIYGASGPAYGSFEVSIDGSSNVSTAHASANTTNYLLFGTSGLTYDNHSLKVMNLGAQNGDEGGNQLLFDYLETTVQLAPAGWVFIQSSTTIDANLSKCNCYKYDSAGDRPKVDFQWQMDNQRIQSRIQWRRIKVY